MKSLRLAIILSLLVPAASAVAGELRGSRAALAKAHRIARKNDYTFLRNAAHVREFIRMERLQRISNSPDLVVKNGVSFPYARPAVKLFVERLGAQYHTITGEQLVVTSLTRPISRQPGNASEMSVHPTGMAVDLRVPANDADRRWLERTLLALEDEAVLDVTKERRPAHYHVAVFPRQYEKYVAGLKR